MNCEQMDGQRKGCADGLRNIMPIPHLAKAGVTTRPVTGTG